MVWGATLSLDRRVSSPSTSTIATLQASDKTLIETDVNTVVPAGNTYSGYDPVAYTIAQSNVAWATTPSEASGATTTTAATPRSHSSMRCQASPARQQRTSCLDYPTERLQTHQRHVGMPWKCQRVSDCQCLTCVMLTRHCFLEPRC